MADVLALGAVRFSRLARTLRGPRGSVELDADAFAVLDTLAARPNAPVAIKDLRRKLTPDALARAGSDEERAVRRVVAALRVLIAALGSTTRIGEPDGLSFALMLPAARQTVRVA